jgi:glucose/arabinose dehydrogenase
MLALVARHAHQPHRAVVRCSVVLVALVALSGSAAATPAGSSAVSVTLSDFGIRLSTGVVAPGRVTFHVLNRGNLPHDFRVSGKKTAPLLHGKQATLSVALARTGSYRFSSDLPGQVQLGMAGLLRIQQPNKATRVPMPVSTRSALSLVAVKTGLPPLTFAVSPPGDMHRLMVVQQNGLVLLLKDGTIASQPFADLRSVVHADGEQGLLSLAFSPDYTTSGLVYAYYNNRNGNIRVVELHRSAGNPDTIDATRRRVLAITKQTADHNGGMMQFGPDGDLYISIGDGGANPPAAIPVGVTGQTLNDLLGSIIRIDPRGGTPYAIPAGNPFAETPGARPEIVAYGLRNPWRTWIDAQTNEMLIGDVGEGAREEIDRLPLNELGLNFGWPCKEGDIVPPNVSLPASCTSAKLTAPIYDYPHSKNRCSIIGGVVDRDPAMKALNGLYLWSDLCDGHLYGLTQIATGSAVVPLDLSVQQPSSFGTDSLGRVYVVTATGGIYRLSVSAGATGSSRLAAA